MTTKHLSTLSNLVDPKRLWRLLAYYAGGLYNRVSEHHIFLLAGGLAFSMFVCVIPLMLIVLAVLGAIVESPSITDQIFSFIDRAIPYQDYASSVREMVSSRLNEFSSYKHQAGVIGIVGLLFAATSLFSSMRTALNTVFGVKNNESILISKLRDLGLIFLVLTFVLISIAILPTLKVIKGFAGSLPMLQRFNEAILSEFTLHGVSFLLIFAAFFIVYFAVPHTRLPRQVIIISSFSAAILWHLAQQVFGFYIVHFVMLKRIYGAYALFIVVAFWIYYTAVVFILGAEIGQLYRERRRKRLGAT